MNVSAAPLLKLLTLPRLQRFCLYGMLFSICLFRLGRVLVGGSAALAPVKLFFGFALLLWIADLIINRDGKTVLRLLRTEANVLFFLFLVVSMLSLINTRQFGEITVTEIVERIKLYLTFLLVAGVVKDRKTLRVALLLFILGSVLTTLVGTYELITGKAFFRYTFRLGLSASKPFEGLTRTQYGGAGRVQGLVSDAGLHGYTMVTFLGLVLPWIFYLRSRLFKVGAVSMVVLYFANLIGTGTRSAWMAWAAAFGVFVIFLRHRHKYVVVAACGAACLVVFLFLALFPHIPTLERLHTRGNESWSWREDTYFEALIMMRDNPVLGIGTGNYLYEYHNYLDERPSLSRYYYGWLHNSYLQIWTENGTAGLLVFLMMLASIGLGVLRSYTRARDREMRGISLGLLLALTGHAVVFSAMPILYQEIGGILMGLCVACANVAREERIACGPRLPEPVTAPA